MKDWSITILTTEVLKDADLIAVTKDAAVTVIVTATVDATTDVAIQDMMIVHLKKHSVLSIRYHVVEAEKTVALVSLFAV